MHDRQKIFLVSVIVLLALIALIEGTVLLRNASNCRAWTDSVYRALCSLVPLKSVRTQADNVLTEKMTKEAIILQETAEDLDIMQDQINRLFYEMTRDMHLVRQNINRQKSFNRNPFHNSLENLQSEISQIFQRAHESRHRSALELIEQDWRNVDKISSMNIEEKGTNYVITVSIPGLERTDIDVSLNGRILTVEAASEHQRTTQDSRTIRTGCFKTQIMMPNDINGETANATYENDILKITIPRDQTGNSLARKVIIM